MIDWSNPLYNQSNLSEGFLNPLEPDGICLRYARELGRDYVFIVSAQQIDKTKALTELVVFLSDDILLEDSNTEIISVHFNPQGKRVYRRFSIEWTPAGPTLSRPKSRAGASHIEYLEALFFRSINAEDFGDDEDE